MTAGASGPDAKRQREPLWRAQPSRIPGAWIVWRDDPGKPGGGEPARSHTGEVRRFTRKIYATEHADALNARPPDHGVADAAPTTRGPGRAGERRG